MKTLKHLLSACWTALLTLFMPGATQDETTKASEYVPTDTFHREKLQGPFPEDNPFLNDPNNTYRRMKWDQDHGWCDYS